MARNFDNEIVRKEVEGLVSDLDSQIPKTCNDGARLASESGDAERKKKLDKSVDRVQKQLELLRRALRKAKGMY